MEWTLNNHILSTYMGFSGSLVGTREGFLVGTRDGSLVGTGDGSLVGKREGIRVGKREGSLVGFVGIFCVGYDRKETKVSCGKGGELM